MNHSRLDLAARQLPRPLANPTPVELDALEPASVPSAPDDTSRVPMAFEDALAATAVGPITLRQCSVIYGTLVKFAAKNWPPKRYVYFDGLRWKNEDENEVRLSPDADLPVWSLWKPNNRKRTFHMCVSPSHFMELDVERNAHHVTLYSSEAMARDHLRPDDLGIVSFEVKEKELRK